MATDPVLRVGDILQYVNNRVSLLNEELVNINLTESDTRSKLQMDSDNRHTYLHQLVELEMKKFFLNGKLDELNTLNDSLITQLGKYQLEKQNG